MPRLVFLVFFILTTVLSPVFSQNSRTDLLNQERAEKSKRLKPRKQSAMEKMMLYVEKKFDEDSGLQTGSDTGFRPQIGTIWTGSGLTGGIGYSNHYFQTSAAYSLRGYQQYSLQLGLNPPKPGYMLKPHRPTDVVQQGAIRKSENYYFAYADLRYRDFPQEDFYGVGPSSDVDDRTTYALSEASYMGITGLQLGRYVRFDVRGGLIRPSIDGGTDDRFPTTQEIFSDQTAPGLRTQPDFINLGSYFVVDYRDKKGNPHKGGIVGIMLSRFDDRGFDRHEFYRLTVDARQYIPLGSSTRVVALRALTSFSDEINGATVPFYMQESLGGSHTLRGYPEFRFRDNNILSLQAEYRWEAAPWLEFALFYDAGKVFPERSQFNFEDMKTSPGAGVRFKLRNSVLLRIDYAKSEEGNILYLKFGSSF